MSSDQQRNSSAYQVGGALAAVVRSAAKGNSHAAAPAAAILWPDKEAHWLAAMPALRKLMPTLCMLGAYVPELRSGPAIWLKCAVAGLLPEVKLEGVPVVYLPGVSRAELRAIESCPRDLQPLAELQYRGVFWSQANAKDWTPVAFLASKNGGLGLDVAQDKATQEALGHSLQAGVLLEHSLVELKGRAINAEWLNGLLAPNPTRDVLVWMNDPDAAQGTWSAARWNVFLKRCTSDFGFDPVSDGVLVAAEKLSRGDGKWSAVWEQYRDSYSSFPRVYDVLSKVQPPQLGLFDDLGPLVGYPQANEQQEAALKYALFACASMTDAQARTAILKADNEHGLRRDWLWARMGESPLALALGHFADLVKRTAQLPSGALPDQISESYQDTGWQVDRAALLAMSAVESKADTDAVGAALRAVYLPWLQATAERLQSAVKDAGFLGLRPSNVTIDPQSDGLCTVFVDGLRYDVAVSLKGRLDELGKTALTARWTSMPSVTASGKAWCSPVAHLINGDKADQDFEPRVASDGKPLSAYNFRKLLQDQGIQPLNKHETGDPTGRGWVECGDLDHYGHEHGVRLARDLNTQLSQVVERVSELKDAGWRKFRIVTDHGWLLIPGGLPKSELPKHQAQTRWGRCAVLKDTAHGTPLTFGWDWCQEVQVAYAPGVDSFIAGSEYAHGGLSLQECLVPVLTLDIEQASPASTKLTIQSVVWKGLRCVVEVTPVVPSLRLDIRTKPAQASSSLVASVKPFEDGKASVAVKDDDHIGLSATVVVLDAEGQVIQKASTSVGS